MELPVSPEGGKPEYISPLKFEVRKVEKLWELASQSPGSLIEAGSSMQDGFQMPTVGLEGNALKFGIDQQRDFPVGEQVGAIIADPQKQHSLESQLQTYLEDDLGVEATERGISVYKKQRNPDGSVGKGAYIATISPSIPPYSPGSSFEYTSSTSDVTSQEKFQEELNRALNLMRVCFSELYRLNGQVIPEGSIIIEPPEEIPDYFYNKYGVKSDPYNYYEINSKLFREKINESVIPFLEKKNPIEPIWDDSYNTREALNKLFKERKSLGFKPSVPTTPEEEGKPSEKPKDEAKKRRDEGVFKKMFGVQDKDLETLRQSIIIEHAPEITFDDIGGQDGAVERARELADQLKDPQAFLEWGALPPRGIIFYGEPGNGKTLIAKALAHDAGVPFIMVKASDIASKWYGDPEKLAHGIFEIARAEADARGGHCIVYFDEVDALMPSRKGNGNMHEATRKVIGTILQEIDGLDTEEGKITIVASTNTPETVDEAFLSRMTEWVEVPPPEPEGIVKIIQIHFSHSAKIAGRQLTAEGLDLTEVAESIQGISGRDIADIVQRVLMNKAKAQKAGANPGLVTQEDIKQAIDSSAKVREVKRRYRTARAMGLSQLAGK